MKYIINPKTGRRIQVGGTTYNKVFNNQKGTKTKGRRKKNKNTKVTPTNSKVIRKSRVGESTTFNRVSSWNKTGKGNTNSKSKLLLGHSGLLENLVKIESVHGLITLNKCNEPLRTKTSLIIPHEKEQLLLPTSNVFRDIRTIFEPLTSHLFDSTNWIKPRKSESFDKLVEMWNKHEETSDLSEFNITEVTYRPKNSYTTDLNISFVNSISHEHMSYFNMGGILDWTSSTFRTLEYHLFTYATDRKYSQVYAVKNWMGKVVMRIPKSWRRHQWTKYITNKRSFRRFIDQIIQPTTLVDFLIDLNSTKHPTHDLSFNDYFSCTLSELQGYFKTHEKNNKIAMFTCRNFYVPYPTDRPLFGFGESVFDKKLKLAKKRSEYRFGEQANYYEKTKPICSLFDSEQVDCSRIPGCDFCDNRCCSIVEHEKYMDKYLDENIGDFVDDNLDE